MEAPAQDATLSRPLAKATRATMIVGAIPYSIPQTSKGQGTESETRTAVKGYKAAIYSCADVRRDIAFIDRDGYANGSHDRDQRVCSSGLNDDFYYVLEEVSRAAP